MVDCSRREIQYCCTAKALSMLLIGHDEEYRLWDRMYLRDKC